MTKRLFPAAILSLLCIHTNAQPAPDFSSLPEELTDRQAIIASLLADSLNGCSIARGEAAGEEEQAAKIERMRETFEPIIKSSSDPESANRMLQQMIQGIRTQQIFTAKKDFELFGTCRIVINPDRVINGSSSETNTYYCRLNDPERDPSIAITEGIAQDVKTILDGRAGWTKMDAESRREDARKSIPHHQQALVDARKTAKSEATIQVFKGLLERAEEDMNTEHFDLQQFTYHWTDERSPVRPGTTTKDPYQLTIMINNTFFTPEAELKNLDKHDAVVSMILIKPKATE